MNEKLELIIREKYADLRKSEKRAADYLLQYEGEIIFQGKNVLDIPMEARGFNIVFQDYALFPNLNVYKNITYGL